MNLTIDVLTGATPSGAVPANSVQTFTPPSGRDSYTVAPGVTPLDDTFLDTRVALSANWQQALGESMRWSAGFSASQEYDYLHLGINGRLERDFNMRNTTAYIGAAIAQDDIEPVGGAPIPLAPMREIDNSRQQARGRVQGRLRRPRRRHAGAEPALAAGTLAIPTAAATAT